jgi:acyl-CoA reductase-like NAD-dependent aldehyde dehydrogenase
MRIASLSVFVASKRVLAENAAHLRFAELVLERMARQRRRNGMEGPDFYARTVLVDRVVPPMRVAPAEAIRALLPFIMSATDAEALRIANDTGFGLAAFVYNPFSGRLAGGVIGINDPRPILPEAPFGVNQSGVGREDRTERLLEHTHCRLAGVRSGRGGAPCAR